MPQRPEPHAGTEWIASIQGLRAVAALAILVFHVALFSGASRQSGWGFLFRDLDVGVMVFFAISGFVLYRPFVAARVTGVRPDLRRYAVRRGVRIVPAYWLALTVFLALGVITLEGGWWAPFVYYGFAQDYSVEWFTNGLPAAWTLGVEVLFYLALPVIALVCSRMARLRSELAALAGAGALSLASHLFLLGQATGRYHLSFTFPALFFAFVPGMAIAAATAGAATPLAGKLRRALLRPASSAYGVTALLLYLALAAGVGSVDRQLMAVGNLAVATLALLAAVGRRRALRPALLASPALVWLGAVSYGIYLWHGPIQQSLNRHLSTPFDATGALAVLGLTIGFSILAAAASWYLLERPLLRLSR